MQRLNSQFYTKLLQVSNNVGMKPEDILNVMASESGISPTAHNANGNASGLVQFMPQTLKSLGYSGTHEDFRKLSAEQQLDYVEKLIKSMTKINGAPFTSATQYYIGNFVPAALKIPGVKNKDPNTIIVSKNPTVAHIPGVSIDREKIFYNANVGLDYDKDGDITYKDISSVLGGAAKKSSFQNAVADLHTYTGYNLKNLGDQPATESPVNFQKSPQNLDAVLNNYLRQVAASNRKIYQKILQSNNITIEIIGSNHNNNFEAARFLSLAINEELNAKTSLHSNENNIEINCKIFGEKIPIYLATKQLSEVLIEEFNKKNNDKLNINFIDKKSSLNLVHPSITESNHRRFLLKQTILRGQS